MIILYLGSELIFGFMYIPFCWCCKQYSSSCKFTLRRHAEQQTLFQVETSTCMNFSAFLNTYSVSLWHTQPRLVAVASEEQNRICDFFFPEHFASKTKFTVVCVYKEGEIKLGEQYFSTASPVLQPPLPPSLSNTCTVHFWTLLFLFSVIIIIYHG